ncbi:butyrophilin subfamily 1 member A1 isoform X2 [Xenopus tropicalis]|uniref:Butyrophilin subfamily 1 member A1 isoform X2 n=1 Tax=Xenopus tropicalis TaxID=8364 RepID=A0A1B8Y7H5_XENTR|nr:butyrophilin subfamily 1 member A1 isoform X2 [Xenopus tropicalis]
MACNMHKTMIAFSILWSLYKASLSVRFKVVSGPSVVATLGSDVLLPCSLTPEMNAENMEIRWFKITYQPYVHLYINGKDDYTAQMPQFANRTELLKENITRGIFLLRIRKVTAQDSGNYYCFVESTEHHGVATVQLQVTAVGSPLVISVITEDTVFCESDGWYPEPYLIWTDNEGNKVIPSMEKVLKDEKSLYHILSAIYLPPTSSNITCTVSSSLNQSKQSSTQTIEMRLPVTCRDLYSRYIVFWPSLVVILMLLGYICFLLKRLGNKNGSYRAEKIMLKKNFGIWVLHNAQCNNVIKGGTFAYVYNSKLFTLFHV